MLSLSPHTTPQRVNSERLHGCTHRRDVTLTRTYRHHAPRGRVLLCWDRSRRVQRVNAQDETVGYNARARRVDVGA
jgi:hypothetical protein